MRMKRPTLHAPPPPLPAALVRPVPKHGAHGAYEAAHPACPHQLLVHPVHGQRQGALLEHLGPLLGRGAGGRVQEEGWQRPDLGQTGAGGGGRWPCAEGWPKSFNMLLEIALSIICICLTDLAWDYPGV